MKLNLPSERVKLVLVDKFISEYAKKTLNSLNIDYIETTSVESIIDCTSTHPDMQFLMFEQRKVLVEKNTYSYYKKLLPDFEIIPIDGIQSPYPKDSALNITILDDKCFLTNYQNNFIGDYISNNKIFIKQGYSKCNICILNESAIITSDKGIIENAINFGVKAYYLPSDDIFLKDYKNGFWGGCTGLIDKNLLFFNGNIEKLSCYSDLKTILTKEKIEPIYYQESFLEDTGSIIPIF